MNLKGRRRFDMLVRVSAFGARRARAFPEQTLGGQTFALVDRIVAELREHAAAQMSRGRHACAMTIVKATARQTLRESLQAIHCTARAMAIDAPGLDRRYRLPRSTGDRALLKAGRVCVRHARESAAAGAFVAHGWPATFAEDLAAVVEHFERTIHDRAAAMLERITARARVQANLRAGLVAVRRLDGIVPNVLRGNPAALAAWQRARHVGRKATPRRNVVSRQVVRSTARPAIRRVA
jgi:hypothetical protein